MKSLTSSVNALIKSFCMLELIYSWFLVAEAIYFPRTLLYFANNLINSRKLNITVGKSDDDVTVTIGILLLTLWGTQDRRYHCWKHPLPSDIEFLH